MPTGYDCLHEMGDPLGAAQHIRRSLAADGTWMIVEPAAGDTVESNLNPIGRVFYGFSTFLCVPSAMSQPGGYALGAQAGEAAIRQVITDAVQPGVRGPTVTAPTGGLQPRVPARRAPQPDLKTASARLRADAVVTGRSARGAGASAPRCAPSCVRATSAAGPSCPVPWRCRWPLPHRRRRESADNS
jgi:hypothetical protein